LKIKKNKGIKCIKPTKKTRSNSPNITFIKEKWPCNKVLNVYTQKPATKKITAPKKPNQNLSIITKLEKICSSPINLKNGGTEKLINKNNNQNPKT
jgi:hypothetical protein